MSDVEMRSKHTPACQLRSSAETALYRHWDANGKLLYVGISLNAVKRLSDHRNTAHWFRRIASVTTTWLPTREAALAAERKAVREESPECNIQLRESNAAAEFRIKKAADSGRSKLLEQIVVYDPVYTIEGAAHALKMGTGAVKNLMRSGRLGHFVEGRRQYITGWHLMDYLEAVCAETERRAA